MSKEARITRISRHHNRKAKLGKAKIKPVTIVDRNEVDISIIDLVLKALYHNSHIDTLHIENDIYTKAGVKIPYVEAERLWEVMLNSGLVNPVAGFGNAGKLKLSRTGYQLMAQFGGYLEYMQSLQNTSEPQTIEEHTNVAEDENNCEELTDGDENIENNNE